MKKNYIIIIIILIILHYYKKKEHFVRVKWKNTTLSKIKIIDTTKLGRGLIAKTNIRKGDIIEVCPSIKDKDTNFVGITLDYIFDAKEKDKNGNNLSVLALGYCALINHSNDYANVTWEIVDDQVIFYALDDINKGDELLTHYGDNYWESRNIKPKN